MNSPASDQEPDVLDRLADALTPADAAKKLRVSVATVWRYVLDGKLSSLCVGGRRLIPLDALRAFVKVGPSKSTATAPQPGRRSESERRDAADAALRECKSLGI